MRGFSRKKRRSRITPVKTHIPLHPLWPVTFFTILSRNLGKEKRVCSFHLDRKKRALYSIEKKPVRGAGAWRPGCRDAPGDLKHRSRMPRAVEGHAATPHKEVDQVGTRPSSTYTSLGRNSDPGRIGG